VRQQRAQQQEALAPVSGVVVDSDLETKVVKIQVRLQQFLFSGYLSINERRITGTQKVE
jgi:hypothetical protein